ncbi:Solute carrier organic anion transporter family member [Gryllus bimaculatus]|nr:Solute carrier organic anion transporter family member [Gryllus bimaculatus]
MSRLAAQGLDNPGFTVGDEAPAAAAEAFGRPFALDDSQYDEIDLTDKSGGDSAATSPDTGEPPPPGAASKGAGDTDGDARCGWCLFRPGLLQRFRTAKWVLFWLCWAGTMQGMVVNGFVNVVISTIERRFALRSTQSGLVAGGYDIASFACMVPVTYLGGRPGASKPRWLGWGVVVMGIGSLVFALPHFASGPYRGATSAPNVCHNVTDLYGETGAVPGCPAAGAGGEAEHLSRYMWVFLLGQLLHGVGASPLYTLGVTFIDENVTKKMSSVYLGIYYTMAIIGPAAGYVLGGELLKVYVDFVTVDSAEMGLTPNSNVWVGAWWIGFLFAGALCLLLAAPLMAFPPALPGAAELQAQKVSEAHGDSRAQAFSKVRELPRALRSLLGNPTFFFLNLAGASEGLLIAGFAAFLPKLIENQFSLSASRAALLVGLITVPAGGGGTFLGGYLVKRLGLTCSGIIKLCVTATVLGAAFTSCFFLSCPNLQFAGVNAPYGNASAGGGAPAATASRRRLDAPCNAGCGCSPARFDPVCGVDGVVTYSPLHAAARARPTLARPQGVRRVRVRDGTAAGDVTRGRRRRRLPGHQRDVRLQVPLHVGLRGARLLHHALHLHGHHARALRHAQILYKSESLKCAVNRCVQDDQRSFALGIQWIKVRLLGTIPAPIVFGKLIDETCRLWQEPCPGFDPSEGACLVYNNDFMARYMLALAFIGKAASLLFFFLAWWFYIPPSSLREALATAGTPSSVETPSVPPTTGPVLMNGHAGPHDDGLPVPA